MIEGLRSAALPSTSSEAMELEGWNRLFSFVWINTKNYFIQNAKTIIVAAQLMHQASR